MHRLSARLDDTGGRVMLLSPRSAAMLVRPIRGRGGYQTLLRRLQRGLCYMDGDAFVTTTIEDVNALVRMSTGAAGRRLGGFQQVALSLLFDALRSEQASPEAPAPLVGQQLLPFRETTPRQPPPALRVLRGGRS
jgi:hypothetical protein